MSAAIVDAVVVGAGVAGLAAALELQSGGCEVSVIDPSDRPGGVMRTDHVGGYVVERGPNTAQVKAPMRRFLAERRLAGALRRAEPASRLRFVVRDGQRVPVPMSPWGLVTTPLLSGRAKLRLLGEPFVRRHAGEPESVAAFVSRRLGPEVVSGLVGPFLTGVYAGDEARLGASSVFPGLVEAEARHGSLLAGGLASLFARGEKGLRGSYAGPAGFGPFARSLADLLAEPPALGARVVALGRDGDRYRVEVTSVSGDLALSCDRVVLAAPAAESAQLMRGLDVEVARALEEIDYAPVVSVPLGVAASDLKAPVEGFGFLVPRGEQHALLGCLFMSQLFPGRAPEGHELLHCMLGGTRWPEAIGVGDAALAERASADLDALLGLRGAPESLGVGRWERAIPQPGPEHAARMGWVGQRLRETHPGLALAGAYVAGVSVADSLASGVDAARWLLASNAG